jgi:putative nucleotidyltransferase with HDIG domain
MEQGNTARQHEPVEANKLVVSIKDLPTLPTVLAEILQVANNPSASAGDLQVVIGRDPALASKVLKIANSAMFGFSRKIESIQQAVVAIGFRRIRSIASAMAVAPVFRTDETGLVDGPLLWSHSVAVAMWTQEIASRTRYQQTDLVFTAGLLHDVGILILNQYAHDSYQQVLTIARDEQLSLWDAEMKVLGTTHERIGASLCAKWMLPAGLTQIISYHHTDEAPVDPAAQILAIADHLANSNGLGEVRFQPDWPAPTRVTQALGLSQADVEELKDKLEDVQQNVSIFKET